MNDKNQLAKALFGGIIFLFSMALAYFAANYLDRSGYFGYWASLFIFAAIYIIVGIIVVRIYSISLGFLFSADVLILNLLSENFGEYNSLVKALIVGIVLVILYLIALLNMIDDEKVAVTPAPVATPPTPGPTMTPPSQTV